MNCNAAPTLRSIVSVLVTPILACVVGCAHAITPVATPPNFGPNVIIFTPTMTPSYIQNTVNAIYNEQANNQFGKQRFALLFEPGTYNVDINVGYYTQVLGLGKQPSDVVINGYIQCTDGNSSNALDNFWRGVENLTIDPIDSGGTNMWAVSQAAPMRRVHVEGNLALSDYGAYSSGGFLADTVVDGNIYSWSQQQWLSRNNNYSNWSNGVWNQVFVGDQNPPSGTFPYPPYTVINQTPAIREKPFLTYTDGAWSVFVPSLRTNSNGASWGGASPEAGTYIPLSKFYIASPLSDSADTINLQLASGKNVLLTPGAYQLDRPLNITNPGTIVLGLGIATLRPGYGTADMTVADVDGVDISGILFDAGLVPSPVLLQVGAPNSSKSHVSNPITLHDDFFRVGGASIGKVKECLEINSSNVIGDDFWIWRADHGTGVGWTMNTANNGLVVNGANDTVYGLAVEHFQQYQTLWNGNGGQVYMYQSEAPYDPPVQSAWMAGAEDGYSSYKVANSVTSHNAYGVGIYCNFDVNPSIVLSNAIECPNTPAVKFNDMVTISLGGMGTISNIIDNTGGAVNSVSEQADLVSFP